MHEVLRLFLILFGALSPIYLKGSVCMNKDRVFDSPSTYPVRFSFAWAGGPDSCDSYKGIESLVEGPRKQEFLKRYQNDADFLIVNAGLHELSASLPVEAYNKAMPRL